MYVYTVSLVYSGLPWDLRKWLLYVGRCGLYMQVELYTVDPFGTCDLADIERWPVYTGQIVQYRLFWDLVTWVLLRGVLPIQWPLYTGFTAHVMLLMS